MKSYREKCPNCETLFIMQKADQRHCTKACADAHKANPDRSGLSGREAKAMFRRFKDAYTSGVEVEHMIERFGLEYYQGGTRRMNDEEKAQAMLMRRAFRPEEVINKQDRLGMGWIFLRKAA